MLFYVRQYYWKAERPSYFCRGLIGNTFGALKEIIIIFGDLVLAFALIEVSGSFATGFCESEIRSFVISFSCFNIGEDIHWEKTGFNSDFWWRVSVVNVECDFAS